MAVRIFKGKSNADLLGLIRKFIIFEIFDLKKNRSLYFCLTILVTSNLFNWQ